MIRPAGRKCLCCGKKMRALVAISGWAIIEEAIDYCTLKCLRHCASKTTAATEQPHLPKAS